MPITSQLPIAAAGISHGDGPGPVPLGAAVPMPAAPPHEKLARYAACLAAAASESQLPFWLLAAVIEQESGFDPRAVSSAGAIGLMQIMPATARDCGLEVAQLWDPAANIRWGARILADDYRVFQQEGSDQRLQFALAAYNGGVGTILAAQELSVRRDLDPHLWASLQQVLPEVSVEIGGRRVEPDFRQIRNYVGAIWRRYQAWRSLPLPPAGDQPAAAS